MAAMTVLNVVSPMVPVMAKSTTKATSSGSTSGNQTNTIKTSNCKGNKKLTGIDAQVFSKITPDHEGTIVCAKSDGFQTKATGTNKVNSYHWTAWYKNSLEEDVDRTQGTGNYHGFSKDKVNVWKQYEENIRKLNGGRFPETKNYVYPTDTKDGKLSFWGDIAGYYSILGDPQYANIHLEAFQQFSYVVEDSQTKKDLKFDANFCDENPHLCKPKQETGKKPSNDKNNKPSKGDSNGKPSNANGGTVIEPPQTNSMEAACNGGVPTWGCNTHFTGGGGMQSSAPPQLDDTYFPGGVGKPSGNSTAVENPNSCPAGSSSASCYGTTTTRREYLVKDGYYTGFYYDYITTVNRYNETKKVKVADATVGANAYATEIAAYSRIALQPGSKGTLTYNVNFDKF